MSGSETVVPEELDSLANRLGSTLGPLFEKAQAQLEATEVNGPAFSQYGVELTAEYPTAHEFGLRDLQTKSQNVASIIDRLGSTAKTWSEAESKSTVRTAGAQ